jgi:hypothetical protein
VCLRQAMAPLQRATFHSVQEELHNSRDDAVNDSSSLVMGWGDFPVALSQEEHPSLVEWTMSSCTQATSSDDAVASPITTTTTGRPTNAHTSSSSSSLRVITFGWQDFPLVGESTTTTTINSRQLESPLNAAAASASASAKIATTGSTSISVKQSRVRFGTAQVREYDIELGDHPLCPHYPWTLSWTHSRETKESITVEDSLDNEVAFQPTRTQRTGPLGPLQRRRRNQYQPISVCDRRSRLADFHAISLSELDALEAERRRQQLQQVKLHCVEINEDEVEAPLSLTNSMSSNTAVLHRTSSTFVLSKNDNDVSVSVDCPSTTNHPPTTATSPSFSRDWWGGGACVGGLLEMELEDGTNHNTHTTALNARYATAWQQAAHLLDMNLHIGGHSVHPGFEIQIYH